MTNFAYGKRDAPHNWYSISLICSLLEQFCLTLCQTVTLNIKNTRVGWFCLCVCLLTRTYLINFLYLILPTYVFLWDVIKNIVTKDRINEMSWSSLQGILQRHNFTWSRRNTLRYVGIHTNPYNTMKHSVCRHDIHIERGEKNPWN